MIIFCCMNHQKRNLTLENIGVPPVNMHGVAQHSHTSNAKRQIEKGFKCGQGEISAAYNVSDMKEKLVTASNTEKLQMLTLAPQFWSRKYCSKYFGVSEYLI